jgi:hypothetical protein
MSQIKILAVMVGILGAATAQAGDVYKYVDAQGKTMYTDKPIPGAVLVSTGTPRPVEAAQRTYAAQQASNAQQLAASNQRIAETQTNTAAASAVAQDLAKSRTERCKKAREIYEQRINSQRLYRPGKDGEREYLSEAELAQARVDARKEMDSICGPQT